MGTTRHIRLQGIIDGGTSINWEWAGHKIVREEGDAESVVDALSDLLVTFTPTRLICRELAHSYGLQGTTFFRRFSAAISRTIWLLRNDQRYFWMIGEAKH